MKTVLKQMIQYSPSGNLGSSLRQRPVGLYLSRDGGLSWTKVRERVIGEEPFSEMAIEVKMISEGIKQLKWWKV